MADGSQGRADSRDEQEVRQRLCEELSSMTISEAYYRILSLLDTAVDEGRRRKPFVDLDTILVETLNLTELPSPVRIMDFGGGTGMPMAAICKNLQLLNKEVIVSVEEPNPESIQKYKERIENFSNTSLDVAYPGPIQDYYGKSLESLRLKKACPQEMQDRILASQVLYHLTSTFDHAADPFEDIKKAVFAMYSNLKPGGELVIVIDVEETTFIWKPALRYFEALFPNTADNFRKIAESRRLLILQGGIVEILNESFPMFTATVSHKDVPYSFVLPTLAEAEALACIHYADGLAVKSCATGSVSTVDESAFDLRVLSFCQNFVGTEGIKSGLSREEDGMWRLPTTAHFTTIKKNKRD